jgi:hypothetical protein
MSWNALEGATHTPSNADTLPTPNDPAGPCPRCGRSSNFTVHVDKSYVLRTIFMNGRMGGTHERADVLTCQGCSESTVVITQRFGTTEDGLVHIYPPPGSGTLDKQVNAGVASAFDEGMRCLSIGANRAAAVMFRSALSLFVKDKGSEAAKGERHLKTALKHMKSEGDLHKSLWEWADHLNQLGNEGAHPEDYDDVTAEEADGLGKFVRHLIRHEYEMPAQLLRAQGLLKDDEHEDAPEPGAGASSVDHGGTPLVNPGDSQMRI